MTDKEYEILMPIFISNGVRKITRSEIISGIVDSIQLNFIKSVIENKNFFDINYVVLYRDDKFQGYQEEINLNESCIAEFEKHKSSI